MMATTVLTVAFAIVGAGCLSVRMAAAPYSKRVLPWSTAALVCFALSAWGAWELLA